MAQRTVSAKIDESGCTMYYKNQKFSKISQQKTESRKNRSIIGKIFKSFISKNMGNRSDSIIHILQSILNQMTMTSVKIEKQRKNEGEKSKSRSEKGRESSEEEIDVFMPFTENESRYRMIYSDMQTGKTQIMSIVSSFICLYLGMPVFIFVQNRNADLIQLRDRLTVCFKELNEYSKIFKAELVVLEPERGKFATKETIKNAMQGGDPKVFVSLFSSTDIDPIIEMVKENKLKRYSIMLDESDALDNGDKKSSVSSSFEELCKHAISIDNVTGTPLTTLVYREISGKNFYIASTPDNYKGLGNVNWKDLPYKAEPCNNTNDDPFVKDPNLIPFLARWNKKFIPSVCVDGKKIPRYLLVRMGRTIEPQLKASIYVHANYPNIVSITWNGGEQGTTMRGKLLPNFSIKLPNSHIKSEYKDGVHYFKNVHIGKLLTYLYNDGYKVDGKLKYERIIVFAGVMADRGITFGADNYRDCEVWWHLTDMYYIGKPSRSIQNLSNVLQACARICGVYNDEVSLSLYSNWIDGVREAYKLQQELIYRVKENVPKDDIIFEYLQDMIVSKHKKVKRMHITNKYVGDPFKWISGSDVDFGGWTEDKRNTVIEGKRSDALQVKIEVEDGKTSDIKKGLEHIYNAYTKQTGYIYKIIKVFADNNFRPLSVKEICQLTDNPKLIISNYNRWEISRHNKYKVLTKLDKDKYIMNPDVRKYLKLNS